MGEDNVRANPGSAGELFATDNIDDVHHPRTKVEHGVDGEAVDTSADNPFPVTTDDQRAAFGEAMIAAYVPLVQFDAVMGIRTTDVVTRVLNTGVADSLDQEFRIDTGTNAAGLASIIGKRANWYRPGQGAGYAFTARFTATGTPPNVVGVADSEQIAGAMTQCDQLAFGFNGVNFGIKHLRGASPEIQTLTVGTFASSGETAVVTLDGVATNVTLTGAGTVEDDAAEIAGTTFAGWTAHQSGADVLFIADEVGDKTNTFSYVSATSVATFANPVTKTGSLGTTTWVTKNNWNRDVMDGSGRSGMTLDETKGNKYRVAQQYLGYGNIFFFVGATDSDRWHLVHVIEWANANTGTNVSNPNMSVGWQVKNTDNTSSVKVYGGSATAGVQGTIKAFRDPESALNTLANIGTTDYKNVVSIRVRGSYNGVVNLSSAQMLETSIAVVSSGNKTGEAILIKNAAISGTRKWAEINPGSFMDVDVAPGTVTSLGGSSPVAIPLPTNDKESKPLVDWDIRLVPGDVLTLASRAVSGTIDVTGGLSWRED